jgi:hypothetical protein
MRLSISLMMILLNLNLFQRLSRHINRHQKPTIFSKNFLSTSFYFSSSKNVGIQPSDHKDFRKLKKNWLTFVRRERRSEGLPAYLPYRQTLAISCYCGKSSISYPHWPPSSYEECTDQLLCLLGRSYLHRSYLAECWRSTDKKRPKQSRLILCISPPFQVARSLLQLPACYTPKTELVRIIFDGGFRPFSGVPTATMDVMIHDTKAENIEDDGLDGTYLPARNPFSSRGCEVCAPT